MFTVRKARTPLDRKAPERANPVIVIAAVLDRTSVTCDGPNPK
jgi:hypothetical protein